MRNLGSRFSGKILLICALGLLGLGAPVFNAGAVAAQDLIVLPDGVASPWKMSEPQPPIAYRDGRPTVVLGSENGHHVAVEVFAPKEVVLTLWVPENSEDLKLVVAGDCVDGGSREFSLVNLPRATLVKQTVPIGRTGRECNVVFSATNLVSLQRAQMIQWDTQKLDSAIARESIIAARKQDAKEAARNETFNARRVEALGLAENMRTLAYELATIHSNTHGIAAVTHGLQVMKHRSDLASAASYFHMDSLVTLAAAAIKNDGIKTWLQKLSGIVTDAAKKVASVFTGGSPVTDLVQNVQRLSGSRELSLFGSTIELELARAVKLNDNGQINWGDLRSKWHLSNQDSSARWYYDHYIQGPLEAMDVLQAEQIRFQHLMLRVANVSRNADLITLRAHSAIDSVVSAGGDPAVSSARLLDEFLQIEKKDETLTALEKSAADRLLAALEKPEGAAFDSMVTVISGRLSDGQAVKRDYERLACELFLLVDNFEADLARRDVFIGHYDTENEIPQYMYDFQEKWNTTAEAALQLLPSWREDIEGFVQCRLPSTDLEGIHH